MGGKYQKQKMSGNLLKIFLIGMLLQFCFSFYPPGVAASDHPEFSSRILQKTQKDEFTDSSQTTLDFSIHLPLVMKPATPKNDLVDGWYLMVDDGHILSRDLTRTYHPFQKHPNNPLIYPDKSWEGDIIQLYGTVVPGFRMWYSSLDDSTGRSQILYATSTDGLTWNKPIINTIGTNALFEGAGANLVTAIQTPQFLDSPMKFMVYQNSAFNGYSSMDGIHTTPYSQNPLYDNGGDVAHFYWDPWKQEYGGAAKEMTIVSGLERRVIRLMRSPDFVNWTEQSTLIEPDNFDDQDMPDIIPNFYGMPIFPIGEQYLGLLWVLHANEIESIYGIVNIQLVSSHDATNWIRQDVASDREPILDVGPYGSWDDGQIYSASKPIKVGDELWLYYSGCDQQHGTRFEYVNCKIGLATQKYHRLASLDGSGIVLTEDIVPDGKSLHVNYNANLGEIQVEILQGGSVVPGYEAENCNPLSGDSLDQLVVWKDRENIPEGSLQLKFYVTNGSLYAFSFE